MQHFTVYPAYSFVRTRTKNWLMPNMKGGTGSKNLRCTLVTGRDLSKVLATLFLVQHSYIFFNYNEKSVLGLRQTKDVP